MESKISDFPKEIAALVQRSTFATCREVRRSVAIVGAKIKKSAHGDFV
jgi:hypothetical protein